MTKKQEKEWVKMSELGFGVVGQSEITCWHRPTKDQIKMLASFLGVTMILTVQSERE